MAVQTLAAVDQFVAGLRGLLAQPLADEERWPRAAELLRELLKDEQLRGRSRSWPFCHFENLLFYEDPDYGFAVNGLIKSPGERTGIHDHAHTWTLYGVLDGGETIERYERLDDGSRAGFAEIRQTGRFGVRPGDVDVVRPWLIHAEENGAGRSVAVIIRSQKIGGFAQNHFEPATNAVLQGPGPTQVPYQLQP